MAKLSRAKIKSDHPQSRDVIEPAEMNVGRGSFRRSRFNTTSNKSLSMETQNCNELARCCLRSNQKHVSRRFPETRKSPIYSRRIFSKHVSFRFRNISHTSHPDQLCSQPPSSQFTRPSFRIRTTNEGRPRSAAPTNAKSNSQPSITRKRKSRKSASIGGFEDTGYNSCGGFFTCHQFAFIVQ